MLALGGGDWIKAIGRIFRRDLPASSTVLNDRLYSYLAYDGYYHATIYNSITNGGQRENINMLLGNAAAADLASLYNPVSEAVDLYQHVFGGDFGQDIRIETDNDPILDPLTQLWQWSNINQQKQVACRLAATHGDVGLRIVARNDPDPTRRRVYIKPEHPSVIRDLERDDRGNVVDAEFQYERVTGIGDEQKIVTIRERMTKESFREWEVRGGDLYPLAEYPNDLGVVPYVLLSHMPSGGTWGLNAFYRALPIIDRLNALAVHINVQIHRHVRAKLAIAASGTAPNAPVDLGDLSVIYMQTNKDTPPPVFQWLVAPLNLADAITQTGKLLEQIEDKLPELKATGGRFLSGQSGETVAQLRKPAEDRLRLARTNYEDALTRAQQIALSFGILYGLWDLGTGMGTREAADRAYRSGAEDHAFNQRELLPLTDMERLAVQVQKQAVGVTRRQSLLEIGYSEDAVTEMVGADEERRRLALEGDRRAVQDYDGIQARLAEVTP